MLSSDFRKISEAYVNEVYEPRRGMPKVRNGWTKDKIKRYIRPSTYGIPRAIEFISEYDSPQDLKDHMFYHGTPYGTSKGMKPSVKQRQDWVDRYGGGGYGQRYWGISVTPDKGIASNFSGPTSRYVSIYPILLAKGAKVEELPDMDDAEEVEDIIEELWNRGVDAVKLGKWGEGGFGENELLVLNPRAICNIGTPDVYKVFGLTKDKLRRPSDEDIRNMWEFSKRYMEMKEWEKSNRRPSTPKPPVDSFVSHVDGNTHYYRRDGYWTSLSKEEYDTEMKEYSDMMAKGAEELAARQREYDERPEAKELADMRRRMSDVVRF